MSDDIILKRSETFKPRRLYGAPTDDDKRPRLVLRRVSKGIATWLSEQSFELTRKQADALQQLPDDVREYVIEEATRKGDESEIKQAVVAAEADGDTDGEVVDDTSSADEAPKKGSLDLMSDPVKFAAMRHFAAVGREHGLHEARTLAALVDSIKGDWRLVSAQLPELPDWPALDLEDPIEGIEARVKLLNHLDEDDYSDLEKLAAAFVKTSGALGLADEQRGNSAAS